MLGSTVWSAGNNIHTISKGGCGKNHASVAVNIAYFFYYLLVYYSFFSFSLYHLIKNTSIIFPVWPIGFLVFLAYIAANYSVSYALERHTALYLVCYGMVFSKITNRLIVRKKKHYEFFSNLNNYFCIF